MRLTARPLALALVLFLATSWAARAQGGPGALRLVRTIEADDSGAPGLPGLPFPPGTDLRLVLDAPSAGAASIVVPDAEAPDAPPRLALEIPDPINLAFARRADGSFRLLLLDGIRRELILLEAGDAGPRVQRLDASAYAVDHPAGMALDPASGRIFILDTAGRKIVRVDTGRRERHSEIELPRGLAGLRGMAFDPTHGNLHLYSPSARELYEVDGAGRLLALRELSAAGPLDLKAMAFASSTDRTDDPAQMHLFLVGEATVTEWSR